ncbi:MAG: cytidine deaminase [Xanthomonadales bacterium]|nr:cytidine deaminase [Xanthomonadales bacterium]
MQNELLTAALAAMKNAHAPYSNFKVGAAVLDADGNIHSGCNVENAAYPEGLCAEAAAIAALVTAGKKEIMQVCIVGESGKNIPPCGGCRQKINEFATPETPIFVCGPEGLLQKFLLKDLLPYSFDRKHLEEAE